MSEVRIDHDKQGINAACGELFLVEGKSAASTLHQALHKPSQSVHAMQGKMLNAERAAKHKIMANDVFHALAARLNCGIADHCQAGDLPFNQVLILTDPDIDGMHSRALLLKLFQIYFHALIVNGKVSIILPPLFRIYTNRSKTTNYAWDKQELADLLKQEDSQSGDVEITQIKGIGQFSSQECAKLLLNPETRRQVSVQ